MAHAKRRSLRNHHGKPNEHAPGDPLGVYLPTIDRWGRGGGRFALTHSKLGWVFLVKPSVSGRGFDARVSVDADALRDFRFPTPWGGNPRSPVFEVAEGAPSASSARDALADWYSHVTPKRGAERNPDWSAIRAKASHYGSRAATGAREAYAWTAPRAKRAAEVTWEGAKSAGRAVKRGAKRAAPVVARGARSAAEGLDRWSQTNGRCAMRNGAALKWEKDGRDHVAATPFGKVVVAEYRTLDGPEWHAFLLVPEKYREGHFRRFLTAMPSLAAAKDMAEWHISRLAK